MSTTQQLEVQTCPQQAKISRRKLLGIGGLVAGGAAVAAHMSQPKTPVFVARNQSYQTDLTRTIKDGLQAVGMVPAQFQGKRVLLKPNLVEPRRDIPHMTTHPMVIVAAADAFRSWGATVKVGEAPGHVRDSEMALIESGVEEALHASNIEFADLNYEDTKRVENAGRKSDLPGFFFPQSVVEADFVVSLPKMKTHHWVGVTASMKNMYGVLPGIKYGWPKNVLHYNGIPETVVDINASLPPTLTIVDGIDCMEGDGPILGSLKKMGLLVIGQSLPSVDATIARIMGMQAERISYLRLAGKLGSVSDFWIEQRGESWKEVKSKFQVLDKPHLTKLLA